MLKDMEMFLKKGKLVLGENLVRSQKQMPLCKKSNSVAVIFSKINKV